VSSRAEREAVTAVTKAEAAKSKQEAENIIQAAVTAKDVDELRTAVVTLAGRVTSLSDALTAVNEIQQRQTETERKTAAIEKDAASAKQVAIELADTTVTKVDAAKAAQAQLEKEKHARKETMTKIYQSVGAVSLLFLAIIVGLVNYQQGKQSSLYTVCQQRNIQNQKVLTVLSRTDPSYPPPTEVQKKNLQDLRDAFAVTDCGKLK